MGVEEHSPPEPGVRMVKKRQRRVVSSPARPAEPDAELLAVLKASAEEDEERQRQLRDLKLKLQERGLVLREVPGDGSCLLHACIAACDLEGVYDVVALRKRVCEMMAEEPYRTAIGQHFSADGNRKFKNFEAYASAPSGGGVLGGGCELERRASSLPWGDSSLSLSLRSVSSVFGSLCSERHPR